MSDNKSFTFTVANDDDKSEFKSITIGAKKPAKKKAPAKKDDKQKEKKEYIRKPLEQSEINELLKDYKVLEKYSLDKINTDLIPYMHLEYANDFNNIIDKNNMSGGGENINKSKEQYYNGNCELIRNFLKKNAPQYLKNDIDKIVDDKTINNLFNKEIDSEIKEEMNKQLSGGSRKTLLGEEEYYNKSEEGQIEQPLVFLS